MDKFNYEKELELEEVKNYIENKSKEYILSKKKIKEILLEERSQSSSIFEAMKSTDTRIEFIMI